MTEPSKNVGPVLFPNHPGTYAPLMITSVSNRRSFFLSAASLAGAAAVSFNLDRSAHANQSDCVPPKLRRCLGESRSAGDRHAARRRRVGRQSLWLHAWKVGPSLRRLCSFSRGQEVHSIPSLFPRQELLVTRMLNTDMATLHASWKNPTMGPAISLRTAARRRGSTCSRPTC